ncbi:MAG: CHASE2 domain-containing protein [Cyanobacteriota bacterium]|nr:CHASE2 domain-containing protein [Cyanobacteriota bacterium]
MSREPTFFSYRCNGGSLSPDDPTYITRPADRKFYNALKQGGLCYVLNSRQMGKSSLVNKTMYELQKEGIACTSIDLSAIIGKNTADEPFYADLMRELTSGFQLQVNRREFRKRHSDLSPRQRFCVFVEEVLLVWVREPIIIFIDEIDSLLRLKSLEEIDDFLSLIRFFYNQRSVKNAYRNLNFALLGVATPYDLIQNKIAIPFNIGQVIEIELAGFTLEEAEPLARGLTEIASDPKAVLKEILFWTGGQPFLTQKLCGLVANSEEWIAFGNEVKRVKQIVRNEILNDWERKDEPVHLRTIRDRLLNEAFESRLKLYQKVLRRKQICHKTLPVYEELWLSGIVAKDGGKLRVYNRIYQEVFNAEWVREQLRWAQFDPPPISWVTALATSVIVAVVVVGARSLGLLQGWELKAFDHLMRQMPQEPPDRRLLVVGADEKDIQKYGHPLPDAILAQLFARLQQHQPAAIGLDIVRDRPVPLEKDSGYQAFVKHLQQDKNLTTVCYFSAKEPNQAIAPPPASPKKSLSFVDTPLDEDDVVRRYFLSRGGNSIEGSSLCQIAHSFGWQLAYLYFQRQGISVTTRGENWQFGSTLTQRLQPRAGGYQNIDARGNQLLLNYRKTPASEQVARQVSVRDILAGNFDPTWVTDRVILIGMVPSSDRRDVHDTPHGKIRGVHIHAHAVSQILSAVEEKRPLLSTFSWWGDAGVILFCSIAGGVIILCKQKSLQPRLILGSSLLILYGFCWIGLTWGLWLPLIPSTVALVISAGSVAIYINIKTQGKQ